jgi:hypothetical protein
MFSQKSYTDMKAHPDFSKFQFTTRGIAGETDRAVRFIPQKETNTFNLDIGDLQPDGPSFTRITDNGDMDSVLTALIMIIELYLERYPTRIIRLKGNTKEKARLYRIALDKYVDALRPHFDINLEEDNRDSNNRDGNNRTGDNRDSDNRASDNRLGDKRGLAPRGQNCLDNIGFLIKRRPGLLFSVHSIKTTRTSHSLIFDKMVSIETHRRLEIGLITQEPVN